MPAAGTEKQARFAIAFAKNGGNATQAAIEAGYSEKSAKDIGRYTFEQPHVQEMIMIELTRQKSRAGAIGLDAIVKVAQSDNAPAAARVAAGRTLMEFAGMVGSNKLDGDPAGAAARTGPAPDYKSILDSFASISRLAMAAQPETVQ